MSHPVAVESRMTEFPMVAKTETSVLRALNLMKKNRIRHLPVVEGDRIVGIVSERDLLRAEPYSGAWSPLVGDVMVAHPYVAAIGTPLLDVTKKMAQEKYGCAVIVDDCDRVKGIFTTIDAVKLLSELLARDDESSSVDFKDWTVEDYFEWDQRG